MIGSLNGTTPGGWTRYAQLIEQAGADALELNVYTVATDPEESGADVETRIVDLCRQVVQSVEIPVAVKLSPFFTSLASFAYRLDAAEAEGLVLFNRFYQPDIDIELLSVQPTLRLSDSSELLLRLRWLATLSRQLSCDLCVSGGVHNARDAIKSLMAGASAVQMVSALLARGPEYLLTVRADMIRWMQDNEYSSLRQLRGSMALDRCPDPRAFERANYLRVLQSWRGAEQEQAGP